MEKRDILLIVGGLSFLVLIVLLSLLLAGRFKVHSCPCECPKVVSQNFIWVFIILATIFISSLLYYLFSSKIEKKEKTIEKNFDVIYSILDKDERKILKELVNKEGEMKQSEISKRYGKIKAHRIVKKLGKKKIISKEKKGRTNIIKLKEELKREIKKGKQK